MRFLRLLPLILVLIVEPTPMLHAETDDPRWEQARQLVRRGAYPDAEQVYASLADELGPDQAARALLLQARAALADGDTDTAEGVLQQLLSAYPGSDQVPGALFSLEQTRRAAGDCGGALDALNTYEARVGPTAIGPYIALQRAQCAGMLQDWSSELLAVRAALSIEDGGPRLARIEAFERAAEADLALGRKQEALDFYDRSLELAGTRGYRAEMLFTTATIAHALGRDDLAVDRYRAVVVDYADQARAPGALDALRDMGRGGVVSPYQAGLVRLNARGYARAAALFEQVDPASPDAGPALLGHAAALLKLDREDEARQDLQAVANGYPDQAGTALLRLGQLLERDGDDVGAEAVYTRMGQAEGLFHVGLVRYLRHDTDGALAAWNAAPDSDDAALQARIQVWRAKVLPAGSADARTALSQAAAAAPNSYYGLRAGELLDGTLSIASANSPGFELSAADAQERAAWLASLHTTPERVAADVAALPGVRRAADLLELGLRTEASWEIDAIMQQYVASGDVAHLSGLADWLSDHELPHLTLRVGRQERDLIGLDSLPRAVQRQLYPAGFGDLVQEAAGRYGVDPLLVLAIIRQESSFDPRAQSSAQARGLTQIVPSTARGIAASLGRGDSFVLRDLYKPSVSLDFGAWFLSRLLNDYQGRAFPALAAYNAGGGNVARWLRRWGDDPDVLVEEIPFVETQTYLRTVYDNYRHYQLLYGNG